MPRAYAAKSLPTRATPRPATNPPLSGSSCAGLCGCEFQARATRQHNNANVLCLGERVTGQGVALDIAELFLNTAFEGGRHLRRINQIEG